MGITIDKEGMKKDFQSLKDKFSGAGAGKDTSTSAYDKFVKDQKNNKKDRDEMLNRLK